MSVAFSKPMKIEHNDTNEILMTPITLIYYLFKEMAKI